MTTRPESDIVAKLENAFQPLHLLALETPQNKRDVELFLRREMQGRVTPPEDFERAVQVVTEKSGGLLLYVHYIRERIAGGNRQGGNAPGWLHGGYFDGPQGRDDHSDHWP